MGSFSGNGPIMPSLVISGRPSRTRQMSALVPPTSIEMMSPKPGRARHAHRADRRRRRGPTARSARAGARRSAALVTPPSDFMMSSGACTPSRVERLAQHAHVAAHRRHHRGVERGGHGALELAELRQHLGRQRHEHARVLLGEDRLHALLVRGIGVGVEEDDRHRGHARAGRAGAPRARASSSSSGREHGAVRVEPLGHLEHAVRA